jgi:hypothetical protein
VSFPRLRPEASADRNFLEVPLLDSWFMKNLSGRGILFYWVGQLSFMGLLALYLFAVQGLSLDDGIGYLIGLGLVFILIWGFTCKAIWPKEETRA